MDERDERAAWRCLENAGITLEEAMKMPPSELQFYPGIGGRHFCKVYELAMKEGCYRNNWKRPRTKKARKA
jgi:hypothetical protein